MTKLTNVKFKQITLYRPSHQEDRIRKAVSDITGIDYTNNPKLRKKIEKGVEIWFDPKEKK